MDKIWEEIQALPQCIVFDLLWQYDAYVIEVTDRQDGSVPVCVGEFYTNEYQDILEQEQAQGD
jgi:hypothetical protein